MYQAVDRFDAELIVGQLDDDRYDRLGARIGLAAAAPLVAIGERRLEAVVAVGEHERIRTYCVADRLLGCGVVDRVQRVARAVFTGALADERRRVDGPGEALGQRESPDRIEVEARRAQQREPVALRLRKGPLVRQNSTFAR